MNNIQKITSDSPEAKSLDITKQNIEQLKQIFPDVFTEGKVDFDALKAALGEVVDDSDERYNFTWSGKAKARQIAQTPSTGTLRPCVEESVNWDETENLFIEGDNLEVLKLLQKSYHKKVKMIYIDPPYNTGKDFVYKDNFNDNVRNYLEQTGQLDNEGNKLSTNSDTSGRYHSNWLNMMYPRLKLARNLLSDEGVIFISLDDNELSNLIQLCNEVFGEDNFIGILSVENNPKGRKNSKFISVSNEYCVIYAKNKSLSHFIENIPKKAEDMALDENGRYVHNSGKRVLVGENNFNNKVVDISSEKNYSVYYSNDSKDIKLIQEKSIDDYDSSLVEKGYKRYFSYRKDELVENTYARAKFLELFSLGALDIQNDKIYEKNFSSTVRIKSMLTNKTYEAIVEGKKTEYKLDLKTTSSGQQMKELFKTSESVFPAPKNISFLETLISLFDGDDFTVLDFFAGSSSTAHACLKYNIEKDKNIKFIMIQLPELCSEKSVAFKEGFRKISELGMRRISLATNSLRDEYGANLDIDFGYKVFNLDYTNISLWDADADNLEDVLRQSIESIKLDRSSEDVLYEILLKYGIELTVPVDTEIVNDKKVFVVGAGALIVCLDDEITSEVVEGIAKLKDELDPETTQVVFKDAGFADSNVKTNAIQILKQAGIDDVKSI